MNVSGLLQDITFMIRGSSLPSEEEMANMTIEDKIKLENEQNQIIQLFNEQALLDVWQTKIKISQLIKEATELRSQILQKQKTLNITEMKLSLNNQKNFMRLNLNEDQNDASIANNIPKSPRLPNKKRKRAEKLQIQDQEIDFNPQIKFKMQVNTQSTSNKSKKVKAQDNVRHVQTYRRKRVRTGFFDFVT